MSVNLNMAFRNGFGFGRTPTSDWYGFRTQERFVRISALSRHNGKSVWLAWSHMSGSFGLRHHCERGTHRRLYTVTGWSEIMNFVADCAASAISQTHSVQMALCTCPSSVINLRI